MLCLENNHIRLDMADPSNKDDRHFFIRYNHCGYIVQMTDRKTGKALLGSPTDEFHPFSGEGFPDEFEIPLGYEQAKVGEPFLKIGVGLLQKLADKHYTNWDMHPVIERFPINTEQALDEIVFAQNGHLNGDISYGYTKKVRINADGSFTIGHSLRNTGAAGWSTLWYSHAFLPLDLQTSRIELEITPNLNQRQASPNWKRDGNRYMFQLGGSFNDECLNWDVIPSSPNRQQVTDASGGYSYLAVGDYPYNELQVYVNKKIISPEPKVIIRLNSGEVFDWSTEYMVVN